MIRVRSRKSVRGSCFERRHGWKSREAIPNWALILVYGSSGVRRSGTAVSWQCSSTVATKRLRLQPMNTVKKGLAEGHPKSSDRVPMYR